MDVDVAGDKGLGRREDVRAAAARTERQHVRVLEQDQNVRHAAGTPLLDQGTLQGQGLDVRHESQAADL
jgi:hypothetical protein